MNLATEKPPTEQTPAQWIDVAVLGGDVHKLDYAAGTTVSAALEQAGIQLDRGQVVTVNGAPVQDQDQVLEPNSAVNVVGRVKNG
ncbi:MAG TPA: hypothetical protein VG992_04495 [Candidatus Saccharimonadales bacterium]|nr:hypothetical protein [Candidatus Saccharimonadales bacterium]